MTVDVRIVDGKLSVTVTPPEGGPWSSVEPLTPTEALEELHRLGVHQTDAMDALTASGLHWQPIHDAEVWRRRGERGRA